MPKKSPVKQTNKITSYFQIMPKKVYGYNKQTDCWHCMECGINMGKSNSRQLCGKYQCFYKDYTE